MGGLKSWFSARQNEPVYQPIDDADGRDGEAGSTPARAASRLDWLEYGIFLTLGVAMLWSWNMFLAAAPYFQTRFANAEYLLTHFQSSIITVSTIGNLSTMAALTKLQAKASYPKRIAASLVINIFCFVILALLTVFLLDMSEEAYFSLLMILVFAASIATGLSQNGAFAFAAGFGVSEYTQAIMTGQGIAGVAPCIVQIISVLSVPASADGGDGAAQESPRSACAYFGTAAVVSAITLVLFGYLVRRNPASDKSKGIVVATQDEDTMPDSVEDLSSSQISQRKVVDLWRLFLKLRWLALAVFVTFTVTMQFAVYTQKILSVKDLATAPRIFEPVAFIPLGFLFWNVGDLIGKTAPVVPLLNIADKPKMVLLLSIARVVFIPLYHLCNIRGQGAVIQSDFFYLVIVQLLFGFTGGWLSSVCMMGPSLWVEEWELESAGALMGLVLVSGLSFGSVVSFAAA